MLKTISKPQELHSRLPQSHIVLLLIVLLTFLICNSTCCADSSKKQPILTPQEKLWLKEHDGKIAIAPCPDYPPIDFVDENGQNAGISHDVLQLVEKRLGFRFKIVRMKTWDEVVTAGKKGEIDGTTSVQKTAERSKYWLFTQPYVTYQTVIITSNRIQGHLSLDKLYGLRVAMVKNYAISEYLAKNYPDLKLILVPNDRTGIHRVSAGDIDAMIADLPTAAYLIEKEGITNLRIAGETGQFFNLSIATRKDLPILNRILDKGLKTITPEEKARIIERWVGVRLVRPFDWRLAWIITTIILAVVLVMLIWNWMLRKHVRRQASELSKANSDLQTQVEENQRTLLALKESESRFRNMVQNIPGAVYQLRVREDGSTYFSYISPQAKEIFGLEADPNAAEWRLGQLILTEDRDTFLKSVYAAIENRTKWNYEGRIKLPSGSIIYIQGIASPTKIGNEVAFDGILLDISERKLSQEMLLQSERQFRELIEQMPIAIVVHTDHRLTYANPETIAMARAESADEIVNRSALDFIHPSLRDVYEKRFLALNNGSVDRLPLMEAKFMALDGTQLDIEGSSAFVIFDGKPSIMSMFRDITQRKIAERAMKTYEDIVKNMQSGLHVYHLENPADDHSLRLVEANPASAASIGCDITAQIGKLVDDVMPGLRKDDITSLLARTALTGESFSIDDIEYEDQVIGQRHYSIRVFHVPDNRVGLLFEDITKQKHADEEKRQFYRDTISSVTDGKLTVGGREEVESYVVQSELELKIASYEDTVLARRVLLDFFSKHAPSDDELHLFITALGEAMTNAIKHAGNGKVLAGIKEDSIWTAVSDQGQGIAALALPKATLKRGHSTKLSMGMGYSIILEASSQVLLDTGPNGTTVVLIKSLTEAKPEMTLDDLPNIW